MIIDIQSMEQFQEIILEDGLFIIDFRAERCWPCRMMHSVMGTLSDYWQTILKIDVDKNQDIAKAFNISSLPHFIFMKDSEPLKNMTGANPINIFNDILQELWNTLSHQTDI